MQVIFTEKTGKYSVGDVADVAAGYARNYLIPQSLAVAATAQALAKSEQLIAEAHKKHEELVKSLTEIAERLKAEKIEFKRRSEDGKHIFGSVTNHDVAEFLHDRGYGIEKKDIELEPATALGEFTAKIKVGQGVAAEVKIRIVPDA